MEVMEELLTVVEEDMEVMEEDRLHFNIMYLLADGLVEEEDMEKEQMEDGVMVVVEDILLLAVMEKLVVAEVMEEALDAKSRIMEIIG